MADPLLPAAYFNGPLADSGEEFDPELLAEFQREIERHEKAVILVKQREQEAILARQRAAQSQIVVEAMKTKCDTMKDKLDLSKQTLREATIRAETKDKVCETINSLKTRAEGLLDRHQIQLNKKSETAAAIKSLAENKIQINCDSESDESYQKPNIQQTALDLQEKLAKSGAKQALNEAKSEDVHDSKTEKSLSTEQDDEENNEISADFTDMVSRLEAKCATVREGLGQMAISEQYMRTKQAQLLAKRKEKEMLEAELRAAQNEREAQAMRRKVEEMAKLLAARKTKLKAIETSIDKKADVVEKVEKMIGRKERVAQYFEKQKSDALAFEKNMPNADK